MYTYQSHQIAQSRSLLSPRKQYRLIILLLLVTASFPIFYEPIPVKAASTDFTPQFLGGLTYTNSVVLGDINNDGWLDIVTGSDGLQIGGQPSTVYQNDGHGNFPIAQSFGIVSNTASVALGDVNGDGWLDIVAGNTGQMSIVYQNDGHGSFPIAQSFGIVSNTASVALGDVNGDGWLDIVAGNTGQQSFIYLNDGRGSFITSKPFGSIQLTRSVVLADLNSDGKLDIITANGDSPSNQPATLQQSFIYFNDGFGSFLNEQMLGQPDFITSSISVGDMNGDGALDIVTVSFLKVRLFLNDGQGKFANSQSIGNLFGSASVTLGDINGDGLLDIIVGSLRGIQKGVVYINNETEFPIPFGLERETTNGIAVGDLNHDGSLDIVAGDYLGQNTIYLNGLPRRLPAPQSFGNPLITSLGGMPLAIGDLNNDNLIDVISIDQKREGVIYNNNGYGLLSMSQILSSTTDNQSIAIGDLNGDNNLDIVVGSRNNPPMQSTIYINNGIGGFSSAIPFGLSSSTFSIALGDVDGDGLLDIVAGNAGQPSMIYINDGKARFNTTYAFTDSDPTTSIALGDLNGDGALDIVTGNGSKPIKIYLNNGMGRFENINIPNNTDININVTVGDVNNDGTVDIIASNFGTRNEIYLNDGTGNSWTAHSFGNTVHFPGNIALGDINGDGALDIVQPNDVFLNDGMGNFLTSFSLTASSTGIYVALGDIDGDGALDIIVGSSTETRMYSNEIMRADHLPNNGPAVIIHRPGTPDAAFFSARRIIDSQTITVPYTLFDPEADPVRAISVTYSLDGGGNWRTAVPTDTVTTDLTTSPTGTNYTFNWDTFASGFFGQSDDVVVRILAYPSVRPTKNGVSGPYQRPYASATTFPFRVRGSQVQVLENNAPVSNALVYRLPKNQTDRAQPIAANADAPPFTTDAQGYLRGRGQIGIGDQLIALEPVSTTNAVSTTYTLYHTNIVPTATGVTGFTVTQPGVQKIDVSAAHPLALFPLDISLEWDARNDAKFMTQLNSDLARTSEFLFNASNGQAALGEVRIFQDKQWWDQVNLRIYASNRLRPNAVVGGAITQPIIDPVSLQANSPPESALVYGPGQLRMGAVWNRFGNASGNLSEDWPRTLAHELSHYMFFLEDNYVGTDSNGNITSIRSCPGIMSDPYATNSKFHPDTDWLPECAQTLSNRETGRSDWATINAFYPLVAPTVKINAPSIAGPSNLPLAVTQIRTYKPITPTKTLDVPIFYLVNPDGSAYQSSASARGYLFQEDPSDASGMATRLTALGQANQDQLQARGAKPGDRVCLIEPAVQRSTAVQGCTEVQQGQEKITLTATPNWPPDIVVTPVTSTTLALTVTGAPTGVATKGLLAQLFPGDDLPPTTPVALSQATDGSYHGTITLAQPVAEAQVRVWVNDPVATARLESISNLAIGGNPGAVLTGGGFARTGGGFARTGGGFARTGGGFARTGGGFARTGGAPVSTAEGDVLLVGDNLTFQVGQFLALQTTSAVPTPPSWATVIGNAYRFTASASAPDLSKTSLSFNYLGGDVPTGEEQGVQVYFWDGAKWNRLPTTLDTYYHIASARNQGPGLYALMSSVQIALQGPGWNIFADPVAGTRPVAETLASIDGAYTTVYGYTANDKERPWKVYDVDAPDWVDTLPTLSYGQGYWIHATEAITLYLKGSAGATNTTAAQRATQADSLPTPPATYYGAVPFATSKTGLTVQAKMNDKICGQAQTAQYTIRGQVYEAYSITVNAADAGNYVGCGVPGQPVTLSFLDGTQEITQIRTAWDNSHVIELRPTTIRLPIIYNASGYRPDVDLAVTSLEVQPTTPQVGQATEVNVTIRNAGTTDITAPFWVDLYVDPRATPQENQTWPQLADYGISWRVYGLKAGETLTLSSRTPNDPLNPSKNYSNFTTFVQGGTHQVYVLVDSYAPGQSTGAVDESNERDNLLGPLNVSVSGSRATSSTAGARLDARP